MDNDGLEKYFMNGFDGQGMILDRYDDKILVVYYRDRMHKEPRAEIMQYNVPDYKTNTIPVDVNLSVGNQIKIHPLGNIYTIKNIDDRKKTCTIEDQDGYNFQKSYSTLIPYNEQIDTVMTNFYKEKNKKEEKQEELKRNQSKMVSISLNNRAVNNNLARNVGKSVTYDSNDLYNAYNRQNASPKDTTNKNKIKAQMVTFFFNTFFENYNNKRISIKPNTLFIICKSENETNFLHGRTYEISRENCPRVYTNIINSIDRVYSVITCDKLFEIFFEQSTLTMPNINYHVYINVQQKEK